VRNSLYEAAGFMPIGIGLSVLFWLLESWIHTFRIGHSDLLQEILQPAPHEIWMRSLVCFIVVSFSVYAQIIIKRLRRAKADLEKLHDDLELRVRERTAELDEVNNKLKGAIKGYKQAEQALRESEYRYRTVVENAREGIIIAQDGIIQFINPHLIDIMGYSDKELISHPFIEFVHPDDQQQVMAIHIKRLKGEEVPHAYEFRIVDKRGNIKWLENNGILIEWGGKLASLSFLRDVTGRKQAEKALRLERNKLHALMDRINRAGIGFSIIGIDHRTQLQNEILEQRFGKILGNLCYEHYVKQEEPCDLCPVTEAIQQNASVEIEQRGRDGRDYQIFSAPLPDADGSISKAIEIFLDITDRKQAKKALAENERRFRATFEQAAVGIAHVATNGRFIRINQKFCDIVGYTRTEMQDRTFQDITHPDDLDADLDYIRQVLAGEISTYSMEKRYFRKDGSIVWVNLTVSLLRDDSGEPNFFISVVEDITERKHLEEQTRQHQVELALVSRLSVVGEMASGLAHELNQPLCAIQSRADLCLRALDGGSENDDKVKENLQTIEGQAERAGNVIRRIKAFVKKREPNRSTVNISSLVRETLAFVDSEIHNNNVNVSLELSEQIPMVLADKVQIEQVLLNLIRNAVEAMAETEEEKRNLTIQTSQDSDDMVKVTVRDNGKGLTSEVEEHLFEAFFTTKPNDLGIGLSISRSIIKIHHGDLWGKHNPDGEGSTFTFILPISESRVYS
jgi:PAS domain S-box-containing protein